MYVIENEAVEAVCKCTGVTDEIARIALQYNRGEIGSAIHSMQSCMRMYMRESKDIHRGL